MQLSPVRSVFFPHLHICFHLFGADDNRDLSDHGEDDLKRQRSNYNGDQLYSNVSIGERTSPANRQLIVQSGLNK